MLVIHINFRPWLTNLTWIWQNTVCSLGLICNIFKIHISWMIWAYEKTVSSSFPEEHKNTWGAHCVLGWKRKEFVVRIKQKTQFQLWADTFSFFLSPLPPGCFEQFIIRGSSSAFGLSCDGTVDQWRNTMLMTNANGQCWLLLVLTFWCWLSTCMSVPSGPSATVAEAQFIIKCYPFVYKGLPYIFYVNKSFWLPGHLLILPA